MVAVVLLFRSSLVTLRLLLKMIVDSAIEKETTEMAAATVAVVDLVVMINS